MVDPLNNDACNTRKLDVYSCLGSTCHPPPPRGLKWYRGGGVGLWYRPRLLQFFALGQKVNWTTLADRESSHVLASTLTVYHIHIQLVHVPTYSQCTYTHTILSLRVPMYKYSQCTHVLVLSVYHIYTYNWYVYSCTFTVSYTHAISTLRVLMY